MRHLLQLQHDQLLFRALAAVAVTGAAFAQATISGTIAGGYQKTTLDTATVIGNTDKGDVGMQTIDIRFGVREDLGGGMTASGFAILENAGGRASEAKRGDAGMTLSGGFGSVSLTNTRSGNLATAGGVYGASLPSVSWDQLGISSLGTRSQVNVISYTSPEVMPGLRISVAQAGVVGTSAGAQVTTTAKQNVFGISYSQGPLTVNFANKSNNDAMVTALTGQRNVLIDNANATAQAAAALTAFGAVEKNQNELNIRYNLGVATVGVGYSSKLTAKGSDLQVFGVSAAVANNITVGFNSGKRGLASYQEVGVNYTLSKRTSIQYAQGNFTPLKAHPTAVTAGDKVTQSRLRVQHTF